MRLTPGFQICKSKLLPRYAASEPCNHKNIVCQMVRQDYLHPKMTEQAEKSYFALSFNWSKFTVKSNIFTTGLAAVICFVTMRLFLYVLSLQQEDPIAAVAVGGNRTQDLWVTNLLSLQVPPRRPEHVLPIIVSLPVVCENSRLRFPV